MVAYKALSEHDLKTLRLNGTESSPPECASNNSSPRLNTISEPDLKDDSTYLELDTWPRTLESTTTLMRDPKPHSRHENVPAVHSTSIQDHGSFIRSGAGVEQSEKPCWSGSECSMSVHSGTPRSPELGTPKSVPDYSENSSVALSLSPRSRKSSQVPSLLHSDIQEPSALPSTAPGQRTPLPSKKEVSSTKDLRETKQGMEEVAQRTTMARDHSQGASDGSSREHSSELAIEMSLKRKSLDSRSVSLGSSSANSPQMRSLSLGGNSSRYRSPSAVPSYDIVGTWASTRDGARSPSSIALITDEPGTPPRKRVALDNDSLQVSARNEPSPGLYNTFSSNPVVSEIVDLSMDASDRSVKPRGRRPSTRDATDWRQSNNNTSDASGSDQNNLSNHPKQDKATNEDRRQLQPIGHTPRMNFQNPDPSQIQTQAEIPTNQLNILPTHHHTLPPRPSITPPPGTSSQLIQKYRPPAVVFTIDNRAESRMLTNDVQSFIEQFTKKARVIPPATQRSTSQCVYPIGVIMWQSLPDFYKWYTETIGLTGIGPLRFELIDVKWQTEKAFVVPEGDLNCFRTLKQYVWDLFWVASNLNGGPSLFQVTISPYQPRGAATSSQPSAWNTANATNPLPRASSGGSLENIMIVAESRTLPSIAASSPRPAGQSLPLSTLTHRTSNIGDILNSKEVKEVKTRRGRRSTSISSTKTAGKSSIESNANNRVPRPSDYIHGPPGPPVNTNRTSWDKSMLRERAQALVSSISSLNYNITNNFKAQREARC